MSLYFSRAVARQHQLLLRRAAFRSQSTASEATSRAKEATGQAASRASEGLSRVQSSAGSALSRVGSAAGGALNAIGNIGGPVGRLVGFVQSLIPPTIYYSRVGLELGKIVFEGRNMSPPSGAVFQQYYQTAWSALRNPSVLLSTAGQSSSPQALLGQLRNISTAQLIGAGVVLAEVVGFFTVGEIIGRFKLVGYRSSRHNHEHE